MNAAVANAPHNRFLRAAALMLASTMCFGLMALTIKVASRSLSTVEIAFFRNAFGLLVLLPILARTHLLGGGASLRTKQLPRYLLRSAIGVGSMLSGFWAIAHLPLSQAIALSYSTPLFVTIAAVIWLGEQVRKRRWAAVIVGFAGVLVVVRPGTGSFSAGSLVALLAAVLSAIVAIQIKQLSRVDAPDTIVLYTYLFWVPISLVTALFAWRWPQPSMWPWLAATGLFGTIAQLLWTRALKMGDVSALQPISFMQLPMVTLAGWLLFDEPIDHWTLAGAAIIFAANLYIAHRESRLARAHATTAPVEAAKPGE